MAPISRCRSSSQLHTQLQTIIVRFEGQRNLSEGHSWPWLRLKILFMKIKNTIRDKGQPWWSPASTQKVLHSMLRMQTQQLLSSQRACMAQHIPQRPQRPLQGRVNQDSPTMSKAFGMLGLISPKPTALPLEVS